MICTTNARVACVFKDPQQNIKNRCNHVIRFLTMMVVLQLHNLHERMASLGSLASSSGSLRQQCHQLWTEFLDNPTRDFSLDAIPC